MFEIGIETQRLISKSRSRSSHKAGIGVGSAVGRESMSKVFCVVVAEDSNAADDLLASPLTSLPPSTALTDINLCLHWASNS